MWRHASTAAMLILLSGCLATGGPVSCGPAPTSHSSLNGAAAISPSDIWAVGSYQKGGPSVPLIDHWDGQSWTSIDAPVGRWDKGAYLSAVSAAGPRDVWAVGQGKTTARDGGLIEHWNGQAWSVVDTPDLGVIEILLRSVTAIAGNDAWAVGDYFDGKQTLALTEHWDGSRWSVVDAPSPAAGDDELWGISAVDGKDVWAVGQQGERGKPGPLPLIEHWDGFAWHVIASSIPASAELTSVSALTANDVWAAGEHLAPGAPLVEHWDGGSWTVASTPHVSNVQIHSIAVVGPGDVWVAGAATQDWLLQHWDGTRWTQTPAAKGTSGVVNTVVAGGEGIWAAGIRYDGDCGPSWALIERWDGKSWRTVHGPHDGPET